MDYLSSLSSSYLLGIINYYSPPKGGKKSSIYASIFLISTTVMGLAGPEKLAEQFPA